MTDDKDDPKDKTSEWSFKVDENVIPKEEIETEKTKSPIKEEYSHRDRKSKLLFKLSDSTRRELRRRQESRESQTGIDFNIDEKFDPILKIKIDENNYKLKRIRYGITLGRDPQKCDVVIEHPSVDHVHCQLEVYRGLVIIKNLSFKGMLYEGRRIRVNQEVIVDYRKPLYIGKLGGVVFSSEVIELSEVDLDYLWRKKEGGQLDRGSALSEEEDGFEQEELPWHKRLWIFIKTVLENRGSKESVLLPWYERLFLFVCTTLALFVAQIYLFQFNMSRPRQDIFWLSAEKMANVAERFVTVGSVNMDRVLWQHLIAFYFFCFFFYPPLNFLAHGSPLQRLLGIQTHHGLFFGRIFVTLRCFLSFVLGPWIASDIPILFKRQTVKERWLNYPIERSMKRNLRWYVGVVLVGGLLISCFFSGSYFYWNRDKLTFKKAHFTPRLFERRKETLQYIEPIEVNFAKIPKRISDVFNPSLKKNIYRSQDIKLTDVPELDQQGIFLSRHLSELDPQHIQFRLVVEKNNLYSNVWKYYLTILNLRTNKILEARQEAEDDFAIVDSNEIND